MAISDAYVRVDCDGPKCNECEEIELTALARSGSYDMRNVERELERLGWKHTDSDQWICPGCSQDTEDDGEEDSE